MAVLDGARQVLDDALKGQPTPGLKVVYGRAGNRNWITPQHAEQFLLQRFKPEQAYTRKFISPAQAERMLPKPEREAIVPFVDRTPPQPALVPESDPREALPAVHTLFQDLTAGSSTTTEVDAVTDFDL